MFATAEVLQKKENFREKATLLMAAILKIAS